MTTVSQQAHNFETTSVQRQGRRCNNVCLLCCLFLPPMSKQQYFSSANVLALKCRLKIQQFGSLLHQSPGHNSFVCKYLSLKGPFKITPVWRLFAPISKRQQFLSANIEALKLEVGGGGGGGVNFWAGVCRWNFEYIPYSYNFQTDKTYLFI